MAESQARRIRAKDVGGFTRRRMESGSAGSRHVTWEAEEYDGWNLWAD
jgi:hypothetical protein